VNLMPFPDHGSLYSSFFLLFSKISRSFPVVARLLNEVGRQGFFRMSDYGFCFGFLCKTRQILLGFLFDISRIRQWNTSQHLFWCRCMKWYGLFGYAEALQTRPFFPRNTILPKPTAFFQGPVGKKYSTRQIRRL